MSNASVTVRIAGESYTLRTEEDPAYLEELAKVVDGRMREVAATGKVASGTRVAVLTALHIADELARARREGRHREEAVAARIAGLSEELRRAIAAVQGEER